MAVLGQRDLERVSVARTPVVEVTCSAAPGNSSQFFVRDRDSTKRNKEISMIGKKTLVILGIILIAFILATVGAFAFRPGNILQLNK